MQFYTGVGARATPNDILKLMREIAVKFAHQGIILRSGGAVGADLAFEYGCNSVPTGRKEIYLACHATPKAMEIAAKFHPAWDRCAPYAQRLHGRNAFQVMGKDLSTPSRCLICCTPDGCTGHVDRTIKTGGTGTAISIANHFKVPVFNLACQAHEDIWRNWLSKETV